MMMTMMTVLLVGTRGVLFFAVFAGHYCCCGESSTDTDVSSCSVVCLSWSDTYLHVLFTCTVLTAPNTRGLTRRIPFYLS